MTTPTISIDDLLSRARAIVAAKAAAKASEVEAKKYAEIARKRPLNAEELELQARADWEPVALVLVLDEWECSCGASGLAPAGLMIHSHHRRMAAERLQAPRFESQVDETLPRRYHYERRVTALCPDCCEQNGFTERHAPAAPRPGPIVGQFAGEGAGFVKEWQELRSAGGRDDDLG